MAAMGRGEKLTRYLIELAFLEPHACWMSLGEGVDVLSGMGCRVVSPEDPAPEDGSLEGILSQFGFSGDGTAELARAARLLGKGGKLVFAQVTEDVTALLLRCRAAGFAVRHMEDITGQWKDLLPKAGRKTHSCVLFICERM